MACRSRRRPEDAGGQAAADNPAGDQREPASRWYWCSNRWRRHRPHGTGSRRRLGRRRWHDGGARRERCRLGAAEATAVEMAANGITRSRAQLPRRVLAEHRVHQAAATKELDVVVHARALRAAHEVSGQRCRVVCGRLEGGALVPCEKGGAEAGAVRPRGGGVRLPFPSRLHEWGWSSWRVAPLSPRIQPRVGVDPRAPGEGPLLP